MVRTRILRISLIQEPSASELILGQKKWVPTQITPATWVDGEPKPDATSRWRPHDDASVDYSVAQIVGEVPVLVESHLQGKRIPSYPISMIAEEVMKNIARYGYTDGDRIHLEHISFEVAVTEIHDGTREEIWLVFTSVDHGKSLTMDAIQESIASVTGEGGLLSSHGRGFFLAQASGFQIDTSGEDRLETGTPQVTQKYLTFRKRLIPPDEEVE